MRILQLCKKFPFPLKDGESIAVTYLSRALASLGCEMTLLSMNTSKHFISIDTLPLDFNHYKNIHTVSLDNRVKVSTAFANLFSKDSYHVSRFVSQAFEDKLIEILSNEQFDVIQLETLYLTPYIDIIRQHSNAVIAMRSHNIEYEIWERISQNTTFLPKKLYLSYLTKKLKRYELENLNEYDYLVAISDRDLYKLKSLGYKNGAISSPIGLQMDKYVDVTAKSVPNSICFIGAMDWMPNVEGLLWFINQVWPEIHRKYPKVTFHVAGRNMPQEIIALAKDNIIMHGEIEDAPMFIKQHDMMIVPLFSGSGMRVKILEAMALSQVVVSTSIGMEGINVAHEKQIMVANTPIEFVKAIASLLEAPNKRNKLAESAFKFVQESFDHQQLAKSLLDKYTALIASNQVN